MRTKQNNALRQAKAAAGSIVAMVTRLEHAWECDGTDCGLTDAEIMVGLNLAGDTATEQDREDYHDEDKAQQAIQEDPLSVEVRTDWHTPGDEDAGKATEYRILLSTGGPATQIVGDLGRLGEPESATLQYQDWFTPWESYHGDEDEQAALLKYALQFYFED